MESTSRAWIRVAAIFGGLILIVLLLALLLSQLVPRAYRIWYARETQLRRLIAAPVGPFHVPQGYVLEGGALPGNLDVTGRPYRMLAIDGREPDVVVLAAFQNRSVSFTKAWYALRVPECEPYEYARSHTLRVGTHTYDVRSQECFMQQIHRRVEFAAFAVPQGTETVIAWGTGYGWRESVMRELLGSLQP